MRKKGVVFYPLLWLLGAHELGSGTGRIPDNGGVGTFDGFGGDDHFFDGEIRRDQVHDFGHDLFHDSPQTSCADLTVDGLLGNQIQGLIGDIQRNAVADNARRVVVTYAARH